MGIADKMWDALATVIRMNDKIEGMSKTIVAQQTKIEDLTGRLIHLEATLQVLMQLSGAKLTSPKSATKQIGHKD